MTDRQSHPYGECSSMGEHRTITRANGTRGRGVPPFAEPSSRGTPARRAPRQPPGRQPRSTATAPDKLC